MRIISYNLNGIRAAINKGFTDWLATDPADIICIQETKAHPDNVNMKPIEDLGYKHYWYSANKKGYSGVAILTRFTPDNIVYGTGHEQSDFEGRVLRLDFGDLTVISAYFPSGTSGDIRQTYKYVWLDEFLEHVNLLKAVRPKLIICGDYNIAHKDIDIHDPKGNKKSSGFLPEEKLWMDKMLGSGYIDSFRHFNNEPHHYSWWSQRFPSVRLQNKGWRIDYILTTENLKPQLLSARILPDVKHSDHCPVFLEIQHTLQP